MTAYSDAETSEFSSFMGADNLQEEDLPTDADFNVTTQIAETVLASDGTAVTIENEPLRKAVLKALNYLRI